MVIKQILVDGQGWFYSKEGKIESFKVNGEMSLIDWFKQKLPNGEEKQFNGKYVIEVDFEPSQPEN